MKKTISLKGKSFYTLLAAFGILILLLLCSAYMISYFALKNESSRFETSLETILALQVQNTGEHYSSDEYSALETELAGNSVLADLASREHIEYDEDVEEAERLLQEYKQSVSYADLICYFYFEKSGYLLCTMLSGEDTSDLAPDYVTEQLADFETMEDGVTEKYLGVDGDDNYYDVCLVKLASGLGLIRVYIGTPSYELPELFLSNMTGVEMYTYDQYGNEHALEEDQELAGLYDYDSLGEEDSDTFAFSYDGHHYIGSYYTFSSRPIRLAVFCRDTAAENRILSLRIVLFAVVCLAVACLSFAILFARWTYKPVEELVSKLPDGIRSEDAALFRDDFGILNRAFDQWAEELREKEQLLQNQDEQAQRLDELIPDSGQLRALASAIAALSEKEALAQYDTLIGQMTELSGKLPDSEDIVFYLLMDMIALTVLDISLPGDISHQRVRGYAQKIRQSQDAEELRAALAAALDRLGGDKDDGKESEEKRFEQIRQYLQDDFRDPNLSAGMVAEKFHISPSVLSRQFRKYNNTGFLEYLHQLRVAEAVRLLRETDKTITEIAGLCGYTNVYTMNRAFKTCAGTTPGKIRSREA